MFGVRKIQRRTLRSSAASSLSNRRQSKLITPVPEEEIEIPPPSEWGPKMWFMMDMGVTQLVTKSATPQQLANFYTSLAAVIPCADCKDHYTKLIRANPPRTRTKEDLEEWLAFVKHEVNENIVRRIREQEKEDKRLDDIARIVAISEKREDSKKSTGSRFSITKISNVPIVKGEGFKVKGCGCRKKHK